MSHLAGALTPAAVAAAADLAAADPDRLTYVQKVCRGLAARMAGSDLPADDVAAVAAVIAPSLMGDGYTDSQAATVAVERAVGLARRDVSGRGEGTSNEASNHAAGSLDDVDEEGQPRIRLVAPQAVDPAARYRITTRDLYRTALAALDSHDDAVTADALLSAEWKGGKVPAAAVRRALDLPPVTGRAGTAWTAHLTEQAPRIQGDLEQAYRAALTVTHGKARRVIDTDAVKADRAGKVRPDTDARVSRGTAPTHSRTVTVSRRALDRLGVLDGGTRRKATEEDYRAGSRLAASLPCSQRPEALDLTPEQRKAERDLAAWLPEPEARTGRRLPGVTVDRTTGEAVAPAGQAGGNGGSGGDRAALRPSRRGRGGRVGSTGPTVPLTGH